MVVKGGRGRKRQGPATTFYRLLPPSTALFRRFLLRWFRAHARPFPWRETRDPYRIIVSEFMLQQTQASRVEQFYPRFLKRYPTVESLARARPQAVRETWEGLGYYARARNLHALARLVVKEHGARIPGDTETLRGLPGVGRYTAGAVACFAFEKREATVDTNVRRVLGRVFLLAGAHGAPRTAHRRSNATAVWELAQRILPRLGRTAWEFNQALMDLGATICVARKPKCPVCPVRKACRIGLQQGRANEGQ